MPPIYQQPDVPARAIYFAATHRRCEIWVGFPRTGSWEVFADWRKMSVIATLAVVGALGVHEVARKLDI